MLTSAEGVTLDGLPVVEWLRLHGNGAGPGQLAEPDATADEPLNVGAAGPLKVARRRTKEDPPE